MKRLPPASARLLIVDDVPDNVEILKDLLTFSGYETLIATNGEDALRLAREASPDLILLDIIMPHMDGYEVCTKLKASEETQAIPVVFVSSLADVQNTLKGFQLGGVDYIVKPYQRAEILARIQTHLTTLRLRRQLEEQNLELERLASTDSLTGVNNRRSFFKIAETEFNDSVQNGKFVAISLFDVDSYKRVNDMHGHQVGDQILSELAQIIDAQVREKDVTARYGGDEFIVLHPSLDKQSAFQIAETIRKKVEDNAFVSGQREIRITISAGVEDTRNCAKDARFDDLLAKADQALYRAKHAGRNRVFVFDERAA